MVVHIKDHKIHHIICLHRERGHPALLYILSENGGRDLVYCVNPPISYIITFTKIVEYH